MLPLTGAEIIITRPQSESVLLQKRLQTLGAIVHSVPSITIRETKLSKVHQLHLQSLDQFDWIIFTSANGVKSFFSQLEIMNISQKSLSNINFATVGPKTESELNKFGISGKFTPTKFETRAIAEQIGNLKGQKILLPRADIAPPLLRQLLEGKEASVIEIPIYQTVYDLSTGRQLNEILMQPQKKYVTFTSASTVTGFIQKLDTEELKQRALQSVVIAIGPVTAQTARAYGFNLIHEADQYTEDGLVEKLIEVHTGK